MLDRALALFGLAVALIIGLYAFAPPGWPKLPPWAMLSGIVFGVLLLGVGLGLVIADQRGLSEPERPDLHLRVLGGNIFVPDSWPSVTGIGLRARVWNTGAPSIITDWALKVIPNGKDAVIAQLTDMPNVLTATGQANSSVLRSDDSLDEKASTVPVGTLPIEGVLLFYVHLPQDVVKANDTTWEVTAKDIYEKPTSVTKLVGDWLSR